MLPVVVTDALPAGVIETLPELVVAIVTFPAVLLRLIPPPAAISCTAPVPAVVIVALLFVPGEILTFAPVPAVTILIAPFADVVRLIPPAVATSCTAPAPDVCTTALFPLGARRITLPLVLVSVSVDVALLFLTTMLVDVVSTTSSPFVLPTYVRSDAGNKLTSPDVVLCTVISFDVEFSVNELVLEIVLLELFTVNDVPNEVILVLGVIVKLPPVVLIVLVDGVIVTIFVPPEFEISICPAPAAGLNVIVPVVLLNVVAPTN